MKTTAIAFCILLASSSNAQLVHYPVSAGGNGHWYEAVSVPTGITWTAARDAAELRRGYLATLESDSENLWVFDNAAGDIDLWYRNSFSDMVGPHIGGFQNFSSPQYSEPAGGWEWITGEAFSDTSWAPGQPNNAGGGNQDTLHYWSTSPTTPTPTWQDRQNNTSDNPRSFIIEYNWVPEGRPVQYPTDEGGNGHWYEVIDVPAGISWTNASAQAQAKGGYLATLTSAAENGWVFDNLAANPAHWFTGSFGFYTGPFIGGFQDTNSPTFSEPSGGWSWNTGENWAFTSWAPGQPNNAGGDQNTLHYWTSDPSSPRLTWQDVADSNGALSPQSYIIEYNFNPTCPADVNNDGVLTAGDFTFWLFAYNANDPECDQNNDGSCTPADFTAWIANFNAGC